MVKVLPIEEDGSDIGEVPDERQTLPSSDINATIQQDDPPIGQPTDHVTTGIPVVKVGQQSDDAVSDAAETGPDAPGALVSQLEPHAAGVDGMSNAFLGPSASEELPAREFGDTVPDAAGNISHGASSTILDMDKDSGMATFSLLRHGEESSLDGPGPGPATHTEQEDNDREEREEEAEKDAEPAVADFVRRGTRKFVRQNTGIGAGDGMLGSGGKKKKAPFQVPQTMYMGHPVGSPAAEFLERQQHRLAQVKARREEVSGLLKLVMEHNPKRSGSDLPDIDEVFPYIRGRENEQQEDRCT